MKKLSIPIMLLLLILTLLFAYKYYNLASSTNTVVNVSKAKCAPCYEYNNVGPAPSLDMNLVRTMTYGYQIQPGVTTRSVWLSLATLKSFIYSIESKTCACDSTLGVRVYNAEYPSDPSWTGIFKPELDALRTSVMIKSGGVNNYQSINTVVLIPTHRINQINYDFDPNDPTTLCNADLKIGGYNSIYTSNQAKNSPSVFTTTRAGSSITALMAQNHGDACPPAPTGSTCPAQGAFFDY
jgi:hypothetical protein